jgi:translation initiation factor 3 subunit M
MISSGLDAAVLDRKIRFLALSSLATAHIGKDITYAEIASTLQIDAKTVEVWIIDGELFPN